MPLLIWIRYPDVIDAHQLLLQNLLDRGEISHGEIHIVELAVIHLLLDDIVNKFTDVGLVRFFQAS